MSNFRQIQTEVKRQAQKSARGDYLHSWYLFQKVNVSLDSISIVSFSSKPKSDAHCDFSALFFSIKFAPEVNVSLAGCGSNKRLRLFLFSLFFFCDNPFFRDLVEGI